MTFTTELYYEPANISVYPVGRIRLQTNCTYTTNYNAEL